MANRLSAEFLFFFESEWNERQLFDKFIFGTISGYSMISNEISENKRQFVVKVKDFKNAAGINI